MKLSTVLSVVTYIAFLSQLFMYPYADTIDETMGNLTSTNETSVSEETFTSTDKMETNTSVSVNDSLAMTPASSEYNSTALPDIALSHTIAASNASNVNDTDSEFEDYTTVVTLEETTSTAMLSVAKEGEVYKSTSVAGVQPAGEKMTSKEDEVYKSTSVAGVQPTGGNMTAGVEPVESMANHSEVMLTSAVEVSEYTTESLTTEVTPYTDVYSPDYDVEFNFTYTNSSASILGSRQASRQGSQYMVTLLLLVLMIITVL